MGGCGQYPPVVGFREDQRRFGPVHGPELFVNAAFQIEHGVSLRGETITFNLGRCKGGSTHRDVYRFRDQATQSGKDRRLYQGVELSGKGAAASCSVVSPGGLVKAMQMPVSCWHQRGRSPGL
jgi:hypothetical protein